MTTHRAKRIVDRWFVTGLSPRRWRTLRRLLERSPEARHYYDQVAGIRRSLAGDAGLDASRIDAIRERLFVQLDDKPRGFKGWLVVAQFAATAIALLVLVIAPRLHESDQLTPRGAAEQGVEARAFCVGRGAREVVHAVAVSEAREPTACAVTDTLQLTYSVTDEARTWARYVFLVGIDGRRRPLWYFPNPNEAASLPLAKGDGEHLAPDSIELAVNHQPGAVAIYALFSSEPLSIDTVSGWLGRAPVGSTPSAQDLATSRLQVQRIRLELTP